MNKISSLLTEEVKHGFSFHCKACGRCCMGAGEGYVFLYGDEITSISAYLNLDLQEFFDRYIDVIETEYILYSKSGKQTKTRIFLKSIVLQQGEDDGKCILLDDNNKCKIYDVRPAQCRTWPIWYMNMTKSKNFKAAKRKCPGFCDSENNNEEECTYYSTKEIIEILKKEIETEREYVLKMKENNGDLRLTYPFLKKISF